MLEINSSKEKESIMSETNPFQAQEDQVKHMIKAPVEHARRTGNLDDHAIQGYGIQDEASNRHST